MQNLHGLVSGLVRLDVDELFVMINRDMFRDPDTILGATRRGPALHIAHPCQINVFNPVQNETKTNLHVHTHIYI